MIASTTLCPTTHINSEYEKIRPVEKGLDGKGDITMLTIIIAWFRCLVMIGREILNDIRGELTESEKRFLTLNPVEWTRNNFPIFCRMYDGPLPEPKNRPKTKYEIIEIKNEKRE